MIERFGYRRLGTPLHAAGAGAGAAYCGAFTAAALVLDHPLELAGLLAAACGAARAAGAGRALRTWAPWALVPVVLFAVVNALISRNGLTVVARLGELPPFGQVDITLEALAYGAVYGLKLSIAGVSSLIFMIAVDPDETLRLMRRISPRLGLAGALATRLVPVLANDAARIAEAQRCRPVQARSPRTWLVRAVLANALERAGEMAATLELRGFGSGAAHGRRGIVARPHRAPEGRRSRQGTAFLATALVLPGLAILCRALGAATWSADPVIRTSVSGLGIVLALSWAPLALAPFLNRRGLPR